MMIKPISKPKSSTNSSWTLAVKEKIKQAPKAPGVYFWLDGSGQVLYVGRATSLRLRLGQYLQSGVDRRIAEMVAQAKNVRYEQTTSLLEAVILEAKNIKHYWPKYNIRDRDDRSFIYIVIPRGDYPRPLIVRGRDLEKLKLPVNQVFGPYQSFSLAQDALRLIRRVFPYSTCRPLSGRACFDYQIGLCPGICIGKISPRAYQKNIRNIRLLLSGERKKLMAALIKDNPVQAKALQHLQDVSLLKKDDDLSAPAVSRLEGYDISHFSGKESYGSMVVFENNEPINSEYRLFKIKEAPAGDDERALLEMLLRRFKHLEWTRPELILIDGGRPQISFLNRELKKNGLELRLVGLSKLGGDELVFGTGLKKSTKDLIVNIKPVLLKLRDEAHRFANYGRKRGGRRQFR